MKNLLKVVSIIGLTVITQTAYSAKVTDTFATGDTLTAAKLNNIKSAVNDNDTRISGIVLTPGPAGPTGATGATGPTGTNADTTITDALNTRITALESALTAHTSATAGNPHSVTSTEVGLGNVENIQVNFTATTAPTVNDDFNASYLVGSVWINTITKLAYVLVDASSGAAVWQFIVSKYAIGGTGPTGGIVFDITDGGLHGLEVTRVDQVSTQWGCYSTTISGANGTVVGTGEQNTMDIIAGCNETTAASVASAYGPGWYLPSKDELNLLYAQKVAGVLGGFTSNYYWSSSQDNSSAAWFQNFASGYQNGYNKGSTIGVRAVRAF